MEKRLIDANEYPCQTCNVSYCYQNCEKFHAWFNKTVDAVEVVRCKDCGFHRDYDGNTTGKVICKRFNTFREPNFYCAYGERKENG